MDYDDASRLTSVTYPSGEGSVTDLFYYNALGQRMEARLSGITWSYLYHGDRVLQEYALGSMKRRSNYTGGSYYDLWLDSWRSGYGYRFPLYDGTGTARGLVDVNQTVTDSYALDAFGTPTGAAQSTPNPYRYGGAWGYMTDPSGLQQLGARFYWPELGRFVQQDPIGDGMNWYAYAGGNPVTRIDPEGRLAVGAVIGGAYGAFGGVSGALTQGGSWRDAVIAGAVVGASGVVLGLLDPTEGIASIGVQVAAGAVIGAGSGAVGDLIGQGIGHLSRGRSGGFHPNWSSVSGSAILGGIGGAAGGLVGGAAASVNTGAAETAYVVGLVESAVSVFGGLLANYVSGNHEPCP